MRQKNHKEIRCKTGVISILMNIHPFVILPQRSLAQGVKNECDMIRQKGVS